MSNLSFFEKVNKLEKNNWGCINIPHNNWEKVRSLNLQEGEVLDFVHELVHVQEGYLFIILSNFGKVIYFGTREGFTIEDLNIKLPQYLIDAIKWKTKYTLEDKDKDLLHVINSYKIESKNKTENIQSRKTIFSSDKTNCAICLDDYQAGDNLIINDCSAGHTYHEKCLSEWKISGANKKCPMCVS